MEKNIKRMSFAALAALAMVSCSNHDEWMTYEEFMAAKYDAAFVQKYGNIDPNHTWGFGETTRAAMGTRAANTNANQWGETWDCVPNVNLTADELAELKALLSPGKETYNTDIFPYENYWVSQVYKGQAPNEEYYATDKDNKATNSKVTGSQQMDYLIAKNGSSYDHINNFNNGNNTNSVYDQNFTDPNTGSHNHEGTTLMVNMSLEGITATNQFGFHDSYGTSHEYNNYLIVYYKGYWYVGFDYEMHKNVNNPGEAKDVNRDWCFTDWIVRITPAYAKGTTPTESEQPKYEDGKAVKGRVFCEDLGSIGDFDFNDVVFDAEIKDNRIYITLWAAGGILDVTVAGVYVHEKLGEGIVNTGVKAGIVEYYKFDVPANGITAIEDIPVVIKKNVEAGYNEDILLKNTLGHAPQKICVPLTTKWVKEYEDISNAYPNFEDYVRNSSIDAFTTGVNEDYLY